MFNQDHSELAAYEITAFEAFEQKYAAMYPPPSRPRRVTISGDWQFWAFIFIGIASVMLAGLRTAEMFYKAAAFTNSMLAWVEAGLAIVAVEVSIVMYSTTLSEDSDHLSKVGLWFGLVLLGSISVVAGFGQAIRLIDNVDQVIVEATQYALSILIGPGASIAAILAGHILGKQIKKIKVTNREDVGDYREGIEEWRRKMVSHWKRSPEYKVLQDGKPMHVIGLKQRQ